MTENVAKFSRLRQRAEAAISGQAIDLNHLSREDVQTLIQELQIYQIELELQNEDLLTAQQQLEASRNRLADLYDFAPVGYFTINGSDVIIEANLTGATMLGVERGRLLGHLFSRLILPEDQDTYYLNRQEFLKTHTPQTFDLRLVRSDGTNFYARLDSAAASEDESHCRIVVSDITEQKQAEAALLQAHEALEARVEARTSDLQKEVIERQQAEKALQASEERYKRLLHSVTDYIYTVTVDQGRAISTKHGLNCVAVTGYTSQEYAADPHLWYQMIYEEDRVTVTDQIAHLLAGQAVPPLEHRLTHKDGSIRWVRHTPVLRRDKEGTVVAYDGLITDITPRKRVEERLAAIHSLGQELTRLRDENAILSRVIAAIRETFACEEAGYELLDESGGVIAQEDGDDDDPAAMLVVPMKMGERIVGYLKAMSQTPTCFTQDDQPLLQTLADQVAVALENARLYQEIHQRAEAEHTAREQADMLREATAALTATIDLQEVLDSILIHLARVVPYDSACIFLWEGEWLRAVAGRGGEMREEVVGHRYPLDDILHQKFDPDGQPLVLINRLLGLGSDELTPGWMAIPLRVRDEIIGYLTLDSQDPNAYSDAQAALAQAFGNKAAIAIQKAQLFEDVRTGQEQLRSLSRRLVELQETERRQIARELHDEVGQALTGLMVGLRLVARDAEQVDVVRERITKLEGTTDTVFENLHRLAMNLRPASLDHLGLVAALRQYIEDFKSRFPLSAQFEVIGLDERRLPSTVETNIYRIVQEALTNAIRHAQATYVDVVLKRDKAKMIVIIEDNGIGFEVDAAGEKTRLGLVGMRERAEMLGGRLVIESTVGVGTTIFVEVPDVHSVAHR